MQATKYVQSVQAIYSIQPRVEVTRDELDPALARLRIWQSDRLKKTHADILNNPRYAPAGNFFLNNIYAPKDFSRRDGDIEYLYNVMSSVLPHFLLTLVSNTIELNNLTNTLDEKLLQVLDNDLDVSDEITPDEYIKAYRLCDNYEERVHQIDLLVDIGKQVNLATKIPFVSTALKLAGVPAHSAGWGEVQDFLTDGYHAFKKIKSAKKFLKVIKKREMLINDRIFAGDPDPF